MWRNQESNPRPLALQAKSLTTRPSLLHCFNFKGSLLKVSFVWHFPILHFVRCCKYYWMFYNRCVWSSDGVVVKLLACGANDPGFDFRFCRYDFRDWLFQSRDMAEIPLKRRQSSKQPTNNDRCVRFPC